MKNFPYLDPELIALFLLRLLLEAVGGNSHRDVLSLTLSSRPCPVPFPLFQLNDDEEKCKKKTKSEAEKRHAVPITAVYEFLGERPPSAPAGPFVLEMGAWCEIAALWPSNGSGLTALTLS